MYHFTFDNSMESAYWIRKLITTSFSTLHLNVIQYFNEKQQILQPKSKNCDNRDLDSHGFQYDVSISYAYVLNAAFAMGARIGRRNLLKQGRLFKKKAIKKTIPRECLLKE